MDLKLDAKGQLKDIPKTIVYVKTRRVSCTGESDDHPLVHYTIGESGEANCNYCDIKFRLDLDDE